jgi:hypothetical protein
VHKAKTYLRRRSWTRPCSWGVKLNPEPAAPSGKLLVAMLLQSKILPLPRQSALGCEIGPCPGSSLGCEIGPCPGSALWRAEAGTPPEIKLTVNDWAPRPHGSKMGTPPVLKLTVNYRVPRPHGRQMGTPLELKLTVNYRVGRQMGTPPELKLTVNYRVPRPHGRQMGTPPELKLTGMTTAPKSSS